MFGILSNPKEMNVRWELLSCDLKFLYRDLSSKICIREIYLFPKLIFFIFSSMLLYLFKVATFLYRSLCFCKWNIVNSFPTKFLSKLTFELKMLKTKNQTQRLCHLCLFFLLLMDISFLTDTYLNLLMTRKLCTHQQKLSMSTLHQCLPPAKPSPRGY